MRPAFIALEGGEGVGKTTQMKLLKERLPTLYPEREFVFTREPGGTPFADKVRELILSDGAKNVDGNTMFGLFAASRAEHIRHVIMPALRAERTVVTDRYVGATYAYQTYAQDNPMSEDLFKAYFFSIPWPALTVILDLDPAIARSRVHGRTEQAFTHFDARPLEFHTRLREGYRRYASAYTRRDAEVVMVDADADTDTVHARVMELIRREFK